MSLTLLDEITTSQSARNSLDNENYNLFSVKVIHEDADPEILTFRSTGAISVSDIIDSIEDAAEMICPTLFLKGEELGDQTWYPGHWQKSLPTGTQFELRDLYHKVKIDVVEVRDGKRYKSYHCSLSLTPASNVESILKLLEVKKGKHFATSGRLVFKQVKLPNNLLLESIGLKSDDILHFYPAEYEFKVQIPSLEGLKASTESLKAYLFQTVGEVKNRVLDSLFDDPNHEGFQFVLKGARISDETRFGDLDLSDRYSRFHLTRASDAAILIHVQNDNGAYFDLRVRPSITVAELKDMVYKKKQYPIDHQTLKFGKEELQDGNRLSSYKVSSGANIDIFLDSVSILLADQYSGEKHNLRVKASDTIRSIKFKIQDLIRIGYQYQTLTLNDTVLTEEMILAEIGLIDEGKLKLDYSDEDSKKFVDSRMQVFVKTLTGKTIQLSLIQWIL